MLLRSGYVLGQGQLAPEAKPHFEEGLGLVFQRWTALCLAVENEWGGSSSRTKADELMEDVLHWFYRQRDHFVDDLDEFLTDAMDQDFNVCAEDNSPREVAQALVTIYDELLRGPSSTLERIRAIAPTGASTSQQQADHNGGGGGEAGGSSSDSSSDEEDDMMVDADHSGAGAPGGPPERQLPVVDEDGFMMVQGRRRGR